VSGQRNIRLLLADVGGTLVTDNNVLTDSQGALPDAHLETKLR
jgi:hypothetical protein